MGVGGCWGAGGSGNGTAVVDPEGHRGKFVTKAKCRPQGLRRLRKETRGLTRAPKTAMRFRPGSIGFLEFRRQVHHG